VVPRFESWLLHWRLERSDKLQCPAGPGLAPFNERRLAGPVSEEPRVRRRQRLREKETAELRAKVASATGATLWKETAAVEEAEFLERKVVVVDNQVLGLLDGGEPLLSVRGLLAHRPTRRYVTVDMGAVKFVANGADIMAPGIVEADPEVKEGDWVWIRDERNKQPLAVGRALVAGPAMVRGKGKAVKSLHHLGDKLWAATAEGA
jgi:PUA-domain protein